LTKAWKGDADEELRHSLRCSCELAVAESESALSRLDVTSHRSPRSRAITCNPEHRTLDPSSPEAQSPKSCCHKKIVCESTVANRVPKGSSGFLSCRGRLQRAQPRCAPISLCQLAPLQRPICLVDRLLPPY